jgi:hypothetical protein
MYSVTMDFPKAHTTQTFSLNVESAHIDQAALNKAIGKYVPFDYTSKLVNNLIEIKLNGKPLLKASIEPSLKKFTGTLSGAQSVTESDLPGLVTVTDKTGKQEHFPYFVAPEMVIANGKVVTAYYDIRTENIIVSMELP